MIFVDVVCAVIFQVHVVNKWCLLLMRVSIIGYLENKLALNSLF